VAVAEAAPEQEVHPNDPSVHVEHEPIYATESSAPEDQPTGDDSII